MLLHFIQQHGVDLIVSHRVDLAVFVPPNQFRRHLDDIFGHQPVLFGAIASGRAAGFQVLAVSLPASMREAVMRRLSEAL